MGQQKEDAMQSEDRIIHFSTELIHPPAPVRKEALQRLYFELSQTRHAAYDDIQLSNPMQNRFHSRRGKKTQSLALFLPDRLVLVEEWTDLALVDYLARMHEVASRTLAARDIRQYIAHTATIRSTFALTHFEDARVFLLDHMCGQNGRISPYFQRPIATGGLRFVLPESEEHAGILNITLESFKQSRNEIFVEVKGVFGRRPVDAEGLSLVADHIRSVRAFISDNISPYLNQYDQPEEAPE
jgi:hypothetical protein